MFETLNQTFLTVIQIIIPLTVGMFLFHFTWRLFKILKYDSYTQYVAPTPKLPTVTQSDSAFSKAARVGAATSKVRTIQLGRFHKP